MHPTNSNFEHIFELFSVNRVTPDTSSRAKNPVHRSLERHSGINPLTLRCDSSRADREGHRARIPAGGAVPTPLQDRRRRDGRRLAGPRHPPQPRRRGETGHKYGRPRHRNGRRGPRTYIARGQERRKAHPSPLHRHVRRRDRVRRTLAGHGILPGSQPRPGHEPGGHVATTRSRADRRADRCGTHRSARRRHRPPRHQTRQHPDRRPRQVPRHRQDQRLRHRPRKERRVRHPGRGHHRHSRVLRTRSCPRRRPHRGQRRLHSGRRSTR